MKKTCSKPDSNPQANYRLKLPNTIVTILIIVIIIILVEQFQKEIIIIEDNRRIYTCMLYAVIYTCAMTNLSYKMI